MLAIQGETSSSNKTSDKYEHSNTRRKWKTLVLRLSMSSASDSPMILSIFFLAFAERRVRDCPQFPHTRWQQDRQWWQVQAEDCL